VKTDTYQCHIDGLRAVAVLSVLFYHLQLPYFRGGYVGVDVFFVISGYLITRLIINELAETHDFSFKRFYVRRFRRLFPALLATLAASFIAGFMLLSPLAFQDFSKEIVASVFSYSNFLFWSQAGYFDTAAELKPLLHVWSLSVEEQFYLVWPLALVLLTRSLNRKAFWTVVALGGGLSLLANHPFAHGEIDWLTAVLPQGVEWFSDSRAAIFYLTPFRAFEFAIGAILVMLTPLMPDQRLVHEGLMVCGLVLIFYSIVGYTNRLIFPYYYALVPCLGAAFVILSQRSFTAGMFVKNQVAVGVGLISYSLYLVHWPLIVFYKYYTFTNPGNFEKGIIALAAVVLATLMYYFVETPFRRPLATAIQPGVDGNRRFVTSCLGFAAGTCVIAATVWSSEGWAWRKHDALTPTEIKAGVQRRFAFIRDACDIAEVDSSRKCDSRRPIQVLVIGNSHEPDGFNAFYELYGANERVNMIQFGTLNLCGVGLSTAGRPILAGWHGKCATRIAKLQDGAFLNSLDVVIYSANFPFSRNKTLLWRLLAYFKKSNPHLRLIVYGGYLSQKRDCAELYNRFGRFDACKNPDYTSNPDFHERENTGIALAKSLEYLYINNFALLCPAGTLASCAVFAGGEPVSYDRNHRSLGFSRYNGRLILDAYGEQLQALGFPRVVAAGN
jgi:peptidoglycan/LPS O-acetylase OafA/YrhL